MIIFILATLMGAAAPLTVFDRPGLTMKRQFQTDEGPVTLIVGAKKGRSVNFKFPEPVEVASSLYVSDRESSAEDPGRKGRKIQTIEIDLDGIPVIEGVRMPDDPSDTKTYRNARIINNVLVTSDEEAEKQFELLDKQNRLTGVREGRILTGLDDQKSKRATKIEDFPAAPSSSEAKRYQPRYEFYQPSRAGLIEPQFFEEGLDNNKEKVVSYSYSTGGGGGLKSLTSKNIVYGSGFAAIPPYNPKDTKDSSSEDPQKQAKKSQISAAKSFSPNAEQPRQFTTGFRPMIGSFGFPKPPPLKPQRRTGAGQFQQSIEQSSRSKVVFPDSDSDSKHRFSYSQGVPSVSEVPIRTYNRETPQSSNSFRSGAPNQYVSQQTQQHSSWYPPQSSAGHSVRQPSPARRDHSESSNTYRQSGIAHNSHSGWSAPHHQQPIRRLQQEHVQGSTINHLNGFNQHHQVPTPHQAFGQSHSSHLINSNIIPADPSDFVVEHSNFQSHPNAPVFSVPVPRPVHSSHSVRHQQQHQSVPQTGLTTYLDPSGQYVYQYPGLEQYDDRPIFDRMMDPIRRVGERFRNALSPMFNAGQRFGNRFRIGERFDKIAAGAVDTDAIPLVAGAGAVAALGALGAYAASKYAAGSLTLPLAIGRKHSDKPPTPNVLMQLAEELESEEPAFIKRFTSSATTTSWLESSCAKRIFCSLVTGAMEEEEEKAPTSARSAGDIFKGDIEYLEKHLNLLLDKVNPELLRKRSLKEAANGVLESVRQRSCRNFTCNKKDDGHSEVTGEK